MNERIPFILKNLPYVSWFSVDSRAARVESVASSTKSPHLIPSGLEPIHHTFQGNIIIQDPSVSMIGFRDPKAIPHTTLYASENSLSRHF